MTLSACNEMPQRLRFERLESRLLLSVTFVSTNQTIGAYDFGFDPNLADFDLDGDLDVVIGSVTSSRLPKKADLAIWFNDGDGRFAEEPVRLNKAPAQVVVGDVDMDGDPDIVTDEHLWLNDGVGQFTRLDGLDGHLSNLGDLDGDGDEDLIASLVSEDRIVLYLNDGEGSFTGKEISDSRSHFALGDLDGDGRFDQLDIVAALQSGTYLIDT